MSAFATKTRGRDMARVRGSHDFHRVILDFKKESSGSVLLLGLCAVGPSILLLDEKFKMLRFISCVTRPAHSAPGPALLQAANPQSANHSPALEL